jgi:hypothetical protein
MESMESMGLEHWLKVAGGPGATEKAMWIRLALTEMIWFLQWFLQHPTGTAICVLSEFRSRGIRMSRLGGRAADICRFRARLRKQVVAFIEITSWI